MVTIQTSMTSREIRKALSVLLKSQVIQSAYKIPHIKYYTLGDDKKIHTQAVQHLIVVIGPKREQLHSKLLDQMLPGWKIIS